MPTSSSCPAPDPARLSTTEFGGPVALAGTPHGGRRRNVDPMRWVTAFLVIVATPLVVLAAAAIVPVGWLAATGALFIVAGLVAYIIARRPPAAPSPTDRSTHE